MINLIPKTISLEIIYETDELVAINKPHGLLVHRSKIAADADEFAVQLLRDQIGQWVYPVHRLDRKTSGVLLFAKSKEVNSAIQMQFQNRLVHKTYVAIVRGYMVAEGTIDYPLKKGNKTQDALTHYRCIERFELNIPSGKFSTSRYSLVELKPVTGRFHQLRKHLAHCLHPIIGDRPHGCNKQNRLWKEHFGMTTMLLHARSLVFEFPISNKIILTATNSLQFQNAYELLKARNIEGHSTLSC